MPTVVWVLSLAFAVLAMVPIGALSFLALIGLLDAVRAPHTRRNFETAWVMLVCIVALSFAWVIIVRVLRVGIAIKQRATDAPARAVRTGRSTLLIVAIVEAIFVIWYFVSDNGSFPMTLSACFAAPAAIVGAMLLVAGRAAERRRSVPVTATAT